jgi:hypothetical protein
MSDVRGEGSDAASSLSIPDTHERIDGGHDDDSACIRVRRQRHRSGASPAAPRIAGTKKPASLPKLVSFSLLMRGGAA